MPNILICESGRGAGGSAAFLYSFLKYLDKTKYDPTVVLNTKGNGPFIKKIEDLNVEIFSLSDGTINKEIKFSKNNLIKYIQIVIGLLKDNFIPIIKLVSILKKRKIDLIFLNQDVVLHLPAIFVSLILRIPCVVRKSGLGVHPESINVWKLYSLLARISEYFIAISNAEYDFHVKSKFPYRKMSVIYPGVDLSEFQPGIDVNKIHDELGISHEINLIGIISRVDYGKGHEDVIAAAPAVLKEYPNAVFLIVGDGEESIKQRLFEQVRLLGLQKKVVFTGWRTDTRNILNEIDIFVHCPNQWREGMGIATLEALASGKPVVITDNWGLSDTTQDDFNGFKVPIGDRASISEKILLLLKDKELRIRMGNNSRKLALELFDIKKNIKLIEDIMMEVLSS
jgi:glycosyltransferase involved in cell wall biosynthesis